MSKITSVEITDFAFEARNIGRVGLGQLVGYRKGAVTEVVRNAIVVETDDGLRGEYVTSWGGTPATRGEMEMLAPFLIGRDALEREGLFDDLKREIRQWSGMGQGPLDIALWDLAGKKYGASVSELLGGYRKRLPPTPRPTWATMRAGSIRRRPTPPSPNGASTWAIGPTRSTAGTTVTRAGKPRTCSTSPRWSATA